MVNFMHLATGAFRYYFRIKLRILTKKIDKCTNDKESSVVLKTSKTKTFKIRQVTLKTR